MAFISGIQIIHAPASALNNAGKDQRTTVENAVATKMIFVKGKEYPYISSQSYRHWLRTTIQNTDERWKTAPVFREDKVAYSDANPIEYDDDDLFGYMRAEGNSTKAKESRNERKGFTPMEKDGKGKSKTVTRITPFKVGTFVGMSSGITRDGFSSMSRHEGDPIPFQHQFYRTSLKGMFSLDLSSMGVFSYENRTGFLNLDDERIRLAQERGLVHDDASKTYRLNDAERIERITSLLQVMPIVSGGAKQGLHYTDVSPAVVVMAVTQGGNNPFQYLIDGDDEGNARPVLEAFEEVAEVWGDTILSPLYVGWVQGYAQGHRSSLKNKLETLSSKYPKGIVLDHPRNVFEQVTNSLQEHTEWLS